MLWRSDGMRRVHHLKGNDYCLAVVSRSQIEIFDYRLEAVG